MSDKPDTLEKVERRIKWTKSATFILAYGANIALSILVFPLVAIPGMSLAFLLSGRISAAKSFNSMSESFPSMDRWLFEITSWSSPAFFMLIMIFLGVVAITILIEKAFDHVFVFKVNISEKTITDSYDLYSRDIVLARLSTAINKGFVSFFINCDGTSNSGSAFYTFRPSSLFGFILSMGSIFGYLSYVSTT